MDRTAWDGATVRGVTDLRVYVFHTDMVGVVYNSVYLEWFEIGRSELMRHRGAAYAEVERRGYSLPVTETHMRFRSAARYDDVVRIETRIGRLRSRVVTFLYEIRCADRLLVEGETMHVPVSHADGRACGFPDWILTALAGQPSMESGYRAPGHAL
jgi:acyl-CoA thioester hydrolase